MVLDQDNLKNGNSNRRKTRTVRVGSVMIGGDHPICVQSMTTTPTRDIQGTVDQILRLTDAGCEVVRVTVQGIKEAEACGEIKNALIQKKCLTPIAADIHFYPPAALLVAEFVEKIRINPGNFADKRATFKQIEYSDESYAQELLKIEEKFTPLVEKCKKYGRALRIGTNHGSLSDRILNRFGNTPEGMVESAFEYAEICRKLDFHQFLFSMKSSNPKVMIAAYRHLVKSMDEKSWDYPLHLGVTEAGFGDEGRIKSAIGIGTLLLEGIGDTIRISLTEDPWHEMDPCRRLINYVEQHRHGISTSPATYTPRISPPLHPLGSVFPFDDKRVKPISLAQAKFVSHRSEGILLKEETPKELEALKDLKPAYLFFAPASDRIKKTKALVNWLQSNHLTIPVILSFKYDTSLEDLIISAGAECGSLLIDGYGVGLHLEGPYPQEVLETLSFNLLQGCRMRATKTEFISCPSCGRTLFDLQQVTKRIQEKTAHLAGVKIAIMGCIVNGPGEMADADFGYVGSRSEKIDLYVGKTCVEKNIDFSEADDRLIALIKEHGRWVEP